MYFPPPNRITQTHARSVISNPCVTWITLNIFHLSVHIHLVNFQTNATSCTELRESLVSKEFQSYRLGVLRMGVEGLFLSYF